MDSVSQPYNINGFVMLQLVYTLQITTSDIYFFIRHYTGMTLSQSSVLFQGTENVQEYLMWYKMVHLMDQKDICGVHIFLIKITHAEQ